MGQPVSSRNTKDSIPVAYCDNATKFDLAKIDQYYELTGSMAREAQRDAALKKSDD
jgi:hypothetical protein